MTNMQLRGMSTLDADVHIFEEERIITDEELLTSDPREYPSVQKAMYERLCRGDDGLPPERVAELKCKYVTHDIPFLKMAPFKVEEAHLDPYIVVYHDVIYDSEIEVVKKMSMPHVSCDCSQSLCNEIRVHLLSVQTSLGG